MTKLTLNFKEFLKKHSLKDDTMVKSDLQRDHEYFIYPKDSTTYSDKGFINIDIGHMGGTHWVCFIVKDNKLYYFDGFGGSPDIFLLQQ